MAKALRAAGARTVVYLRDVEFHELGADPAELPGLRYIANSRFVAVKFRAAYGPEPEVLRPLFRAERFRPQRAPRAVPLVHPHPVQGRYLAFELIRIFPEPPFCF